ncbi:putative FIST domain protein [Vibrio nigripulchritudo SFn27]|uniref:Putative FIST domain protein n=1 Tax=Vibrio nigripulchritudo TaxID=28173 RepID=U4KCF3_9VIBR|nr:FIST N-terminal domain-containing protein [Vibrio nigripulchritudo]CCN83258.1 putative FIST domain protein [Vibrio nigripulchritudo BLFn1]CCN86412.1 putative FIST domain protein [Vibrio nigripulchritudo SFn27]CCN96799.1 putative FIST domain protein [Vibrio nigripulchritudo ENn2]CCO40237.1 putative FIST domain protein [Vibrio nigripulchritudo SFn135]CCO51973.1 putative FIST domain protein [Vibrio nigripulchritudo Wn13]
MKTLQSVWTGEQWKGLEDIKALDSENTLALLFGSLDSSQEAIKRLREAMPNTLLTGCTTAGEVSGLQVHENALVATFVCFEKTPIRMLRLRITDEHADQKDVGIQMAKQLMETDNLKHILVLSDGLHVNGCQLTEGFECAVPDHIKVTGGLAGDNEAFEKTLVLYQDEVEEKQVVAVGFYGDAISVSYGSRGGWSSFGLQRKITHSEDNVLYELDDENALDIYKSYLGELACELPASGLRFPLEITEPTKSTKLVRTLLGIDETTGSITFAGNVPRGATAMLMRANVDSLIDGAHDAAEVCRDHLDGSPQFAILISCVGRKLLLKQLVEDEIEVVNEELGDQTLLCGFYSYGEIAPYDKNFPSELHNQTMTITAFSES